MFKLEFQKIFLIIMKFLMQIISSTLLCVQSHTLDCGRMVCAGGRGYLLLLVLVTSLLAYTAGLATCKQRDNRRPRKWRRSRGNGIIEVIVPYNFVEKENEAGAEEEGEQAARRVDLN